MIKTSLYLKQPILYKTVSKTFSLSHFAKPSTMSFFVSCNITLKLEILGRGLFFFFLVAGGGGEQLDFLSIVSKMKGKYLIYVAK